MFLGASNPLVLHHKYTVEFNCDFKLAKYPFDTQECNMTFQLTKSTSTEAVMDMVKTWYTGPHELIEYKVVNVTKSEHYNCGDLQSVAIQYYSTYKYSRTENCD